MDAGRLGADVFGAEAGQQHRQGERVIDLAHRAAPTEVKRESRPARNVRHL